eukprot:scaffold205823_cov36-Tisochrysis_lutea.AAC.4
MCAQSRELSSPPYSPCVRFPTKLRMQAPTVELYMEKTFNVMMHVLTASVVAHQSASFIGELFKHRPRNVKSPQHGGTIN